MRSAAKPVLSGHGKDIVWDGLNVSAESLLKAKTLECSVYLTRKCNLKCQYCRIVETTLPEELSMEQWIEAMDIIEGLGVKFVNIAGGEPTVLKGLGRLISHLNKTFMSYSIVSNSMFNDDKLDEMVDAGLKAYVASIDVLDSRDLSPHDLRKSNAGMRMLEKLRLRNVPNLCANIVISAKNLNSVVVAAKYLSDSGFLVNLCPVIWGRGDKWDDAKEADPSYRLTEEHKEKLSAMAIELIEMKRAGALIVPTEAYLRGLPVHAIGLDWKCFDGNRATDPPRLIVDADGSLMTCINTRGEVSKKYTIFDLRDDVAYERFSPDWWMDAKKCKGCYWSTMVMAKERLDMLDSFRKGILKTNANQR
ncbi:MAG TPA: radical SAM protein [Thermodesulfobacteriota bacterium]|nr:radical SAM protein [Thermodesulfobacteriota bacterium]